MWGTASGLIRTQCLFFGLSTTDIMAPLSFNFCDLTCRYARTPEDSAVDGSGSCRTFIALYCEQKKSLVHKNMPCSKRKPRQEQKKK